ncbi:MAG: DNA polymerase III subunit beta [Candidatus Brocadiaceae bacterium]|nr:DNA polymerase III subunit beta [Candidatus Brocadiaceae bacterium]
MKLVAEREALFHGFQRVGAIVSTNIQQPVYRNVRLQASEDVWLSATDLEVGIALRIPGAHVEETGVVLLPPTRVAPILGATPDEHVSMVEDDGAVRIETNDGRFRILGEDPTDFPDMPELPATGVVEVDPEVFKYAVRRTLFAAAEERGRFALNGVLFVLGKDEGLEVVAADGAQLAHVRKKVSNPEGIQTEFIVMKRGLELLMRMADYGREPVRFAATENQFIAENDAGRMFCQLVDGQFPNYREVIPEEGKVKVQLPVKEMLSAVKRAFFLTTEQARVVDFRFVSGELLISAESADIGRADVRLPIDYDGEEATISFNPAFLQNMLSVVERDVVKMRFNDHRSPCVLKSGLDYTYVLSPVVREEAEV